MFYRGVIFEKIMRKRFFKDWNFTGYATDGLQGLNIHNYPIIDFYKTVGNKLKVASMKTTKTKDVASWMSTNAKHLKELNALTDDKTIGTLTGKAEPYLYIFVPKGTDITDWATKINKNYTSINVVMKTIEESL